MVIIGTAGSLLAAFLIWGLITRNKLSVNLNTYDHKLFDDLQVDLPSTGAIYFLRNNNINGFPFETSKLNDIGNFSVKWKSPNLKFNDSYLNHKKESLLKAIDHYLSSVNLHTVPLDTAGWVTIPQDLELSDPEKFKISVKELYLKADVILKLYDEIINYGKNKIS